MKAVVESQGKGKGKGIKEAAPQFRFWWGQSVLTTYLPNLVNVVNDITQTIAVYQPQH